MRVIYYTKIDFITAKHFSLFLLLFPVLSLVMLMADSSFSGASALFCTLYCLFAGIIMSSVPHSTQAKDNSGFLNLLPSRRGDAIRGHFLFSFCCLSFFFLMSLLVIRAAGIFAAKAYPISGPISLILLGLALICAGLETLLFYILPGSPAQVANLLRVIPAFLYFFGLMFLKDLLPESIPNFVHWINPKSSVLLFLFGLLCFFLSMELCILLTRKRDTL